MEKKTRYCHFCGDKTNDDKCVICGRSTSSVSLRIKETELNLVTDDIAETRENFSGDKGAAEAKLQHSRLSKSNLLHMVEGEHPYFIRTPELSDPALFRKAVSALAAIVVFIIFGCLLLIMFTR